MVVCVYVRNGIVWAPESILTEVKKVGQGLVGDSRRDPTPTRLVSGES